MFDKRVNCKLCGKFRECKTYVHKEKPVMACKGCIKRNRPTIFDDLLKGLI